MTKIRKKIKTINDLPKDQNLGGVKFKHPETGETCIWQSQWHKGIWFKKDKNDSQTYPLFVEDLSEALKFEVVE